MSLNLTLAQAQLALIQVRSELNAKPELLNDSKHWITVNGGEHAETGEKTGRHLLINGDNEVIGGAGGALNGKKLEHVKSKSGDVEKPKDKEPEKKPPRDKVNAISKRFDTGKKLSKEDRQKVMSTLKDVYKEKDAEKEIRINNNGDEYSAYPYQPDFFEKSDITGAMVRHYVTLPDGRVAHPTELFPDITQAKIDAIFYEQKQKADILNKEINKLTSNQFDSVIDAGRFWDEKSDNSISQITGKPTIFGSLDRIALEKDGKVIMPPESLLAMNQDIAEKLEEQGWNKYKGTKNKEDSIKPHRATNNSTETQATGIKSSGGKSESELNKDIGKEKKQPDGVYPTLSIFQKDTEPFGEISLFAAKMAGISDKWETHNKTLREILEAIKPAETSNWRTEKELNDPGFAYLYRRGMEQAWRTRFDVKELEEANPGLNILDKIRGPFALNLISRLANQDKYINVRNYIDDSKPYSKIKKSKSR